jgi:two-component system probable response regulator PhcQ
VQSFSVLLVDDEEDVRNALVRTLRREGWDLHTAASGAEALEILKRVPVDLILTDHRMPGMTGLELVKVVRERYPKVMRVILTGYAEFETVKAAVNEAEVFRFLTKPWDSEDLRLTLRTAAQRRALEREQDDSPAAARRQQGQLAELEKTHPGITQVERDETGAIVIPEEE